MFGRVAASMRIAHISHRSMVGVRALSSKPIFSQEPILRDRKGQPEGDFIRPQIEGDHLVATKETPIAEPKTPPSVKDYGVQQAPNYAQTWSPSQRPKSMAMRGPRFEQTNMPLQPASLSAMELINNEPIRMVTKRVVSCDGGDGPLGHPRVYINLDKPGPKSCPYCGIRYQKEDKKFHYVP